MVSLARMPSLSSFLPASEAAPMPRSRMNAEMPLAPFDLSVTAMITSVSADVPCVMNIFEPFSTQHAPSLTAVVRIAAASLPEPGSVSPHAASFSPFASGTRYFCFCSSVREHRDVRRAEAVVRGHRQRHARIDARELFDADAVIDRAHAGAAVVLGELDAHQAELGELRQQLFGKVLSLVPRPSRWDESRFRRIRERSCEGGLLVGQRKIHRRSYSRQSLPDELFPTIASR